MEELTPTQRERVDARIDRWGQSPMLLYFSGILVVLLLVEVDRWLPIVRSAPWLLLIGVVVSSFGLVTSELSLRRTALWSLLWPVLTFAALAVRIIVGVLIFGEPPFVMD